MDMKRPTLKRYVNGTWIIGTAEEKTEKIKPMSSCVNPIQNLDTKKLNFISAFFSKENIFMMMYGVSLGVSVALNVYQYSLLKAYLKIIVLAS